MVHDQRRSRASTATLCRETGRVDFIPVYEVFPDRIVAYVPPSASVFRISAPPGIGVTTLHNGDFPFLEPDELPVRLTAVDDRTYLLEVRHNEFRYGENNLRVFFLRLAQGNAVSHVDSFQEIWRGSMANFYPYFEWTKGTLFLMSANETAFVCDWLDHALPPKNCVSSEQSSVESIASRLIAPSLDSRGFEYIYPVDTEGGYVARGNGQIVVGRGLKSKPVLSLHRLQRKSVSGTSDANLALPEESLSGYSISLSPNAAWLTLLAPIDWTEEDSLPDIEGLPIDVGDLHLVALSDLLRSE